MEGLKRSEETRLSLTRLSPVLATDGSDQERPTSGSEVLLVRRFYLGIIRRAF